MLGKLSVREYNSLLSQSYNLKNFDINGKLETETFQDKQARLKEEIKQARNG